MTMVALVQIALLTVILLLILSRSPSKSGELTGQLAELRPLLEKLDSTFRDEFRALRAELSDQAREARGEAAERSRLVREELLTEFKRFKDEVNEAMGQSRREQTDNADRSRKSADQKLTEIRQDIASQSDELKTKQGNMAENLMASARQNFSLLGNDLRETNRQLNEMVQERLTEMGSKIAELSVASERSQEALRNAVEGRLDKLNESNIQKLEEVRVTVDEKLHSTLEKRLTDSFGMVSEQLGNVQRGLGEMKDLATGVGDLKRVLTNIKTRGGYGEVQLEMLLDQMLAPEQFVKNASIRHDTQETVEFAVKLPGPANGESILLPVDAKFPREAWERLEDAKDHGDQAAIKQAAEKLEIAIRSAAKDISAKYVEPPITTNFAVMFLSTEGLFAEVVRRAGLVDELQSKFRVTVAGPTTFAALLTSLQMGFRTLAIQKKGSEVWKILAATKLEFEKFGGLMDRVDKNIGTVQNTLREVGTRTRVITRKLRDVESTNLQAPDAAALLGLTEPEEDAGDNADAVTPASEAP